MKLTKRKLQQIIKEEFDNMINLKEGKTINFDNFRMEVEDDDSIDYSYNNKIFAVSAPNGEVTIQDESTLHKAMQRIKELYDNNVYPLDRNDTVIDRKGWLKPRSGRGVMYNYSNNKIINKNRLFQFLSFVIEMGG